MASYFIHTHSTGSPWRRPGGLSNAITNKYHQPISTREREKRRNPARPRPPPQPTEPWLSELSDNEKAKPGASAPPPTAHRALAVETVGQLSELSGPSVLCRTDIARDR